jgi:hypothetical protein
LPPALTPIRSPSRGFWWTKAQSVRIEHPALGLGHRPGVPRAIRAVSKITSPASA